MPHPTATTRTRPAPAALGPETRRATPAAPAAESRLGRLAADAAGCAAGCVVGRFPVRYGGRVQ
ncbi:hypothetical protein ACH4L5_12475 [Streptomyces sp. NPDC017405]|uniref:hypothetical protein n=1 Tax=unclassified Streptomyces TaxID=2593676 RepID=UPI003795AB40